jgi:hypothetical protein
VSRTPRQRHKRKMREAEAVEPTVIIAEPAPYEPSPEFTRAYSQVQPEAVRWESSGATIRATWLLPTNRPAERGPRG